MKNLNLMQTVENNNWKIELLDFNRTKHYYTGKKISHWEKYYGKKPYWVNCVRTWDDDMILTGEFETLAEARDVFAEIATSPEDFDLVEKYGFR